ncbi:MAG: hypothetical protein OXL68_00755 [Paracoccaceae bacterium]|nr:hypothetical protein [Paracoccaceae bacterium]
MKDDVLTGVRNAKRRVSKGEYKKGRHSFDILSAIDPSTVVDASPHVRRLARERDTMLRKWRRPQGGPDDYQRALAVEFSTADLS